ncbi:MAG: type III pantothenate kinase [Pirellula sp.]|jgi:type III pantothenate kinase|nr:type III pantothenate kinase [Pirellula sp.]
MILVDIGNSGLRVIRIEPHSEVLESNIWKLSWPANFSVKGKSVPLQSQSRNHKWCEQDDLSAFEWLVDSIEPHHSETWYVSSVKQTALDQLQSVCKLRSVGNQFRKISYLDLPMNVGVDAPEKVGMDRLVSSWEAWNVINVDRGHAGSSPIATDHRPVITVQAGTAVTVDLVTADGVFRGGAIMPGLGLSLQLLAAGTEQLPWIANGAVSGLPQLPGTNTTQAIAAGVHASLAGGTTFLINRYRQEYDRDDIPVIVTGGDAKVLQAFIQPPCIPLDHMVLRGLNRLIATQRLSKDHYDELRSS